MTFRAFGTTGKNKCNAKEHKLRLFLRKEVKGKTTVLAVLPFFYCFNDAFQLKRLRKSGKGN